MEPNVQRLPHAELEVLASLWQKGEASVHDLCEATKEYRPMSHGAMATLLKRLELKDLVTKKKSKVGKAFLYRAKRGPRLTYRRIMNDLCERIFARSRTSVVTVLRDIIPPTREEITALERLLERISQDRGTRKRDRCS